MEQEKRMVDGYEIVSAFRIGGKEVLLGINEKKQDDEKYFCGFAKQEGIFERYSECVVSGDYVELAVEYGRRISNEAEMFQESVRKLGIPTTVLTVQDCIPDDYRNDINGKVVAMKAEVFYPEYQRADNQIVLVTGGFGASANSRGTAVFVTKLFSGEHTQMRRSDVLGEIKPDCLPEWAKDRALLFTHAHKHNKQFQYGGKQFCPYRRLTRGEGSFSAATRNIASDPNLGIMNKSYPNSKYPYDYNDFYAAARGMTCDLFVCADNGRLYMPAEKELFEWRGEIGKADKEYAKAPQQKPRKKDYER